MTVTVGIHVYEQPELLFETLMQLKRCMPDPYDLLLIADAPDEATEAALSVLSHLKQSRLDTPSGGAAVFNLLCRSASTDAVVFLENGTLPGPEALPLLLRALAERDDNGLAGPSTNSCWNEQGAFHGTGSSAAQIAETSAEARRLYGNSSSTLDPLYSLGDFCYAVKRRVWETIGPADEQYGLGPCWEMDYNVRAARAGLRGVWVRGAYVFRRPFPPRRQQAERALFDANRRLYQTKFCARQLGGANAYFRTHCRGDACPNFAPHLGPVTTVQVSGRQPRVSCIMPTANRREFVPQAIQYFLDQDYPNRELLILDDGLQPVADLIPEDPRIRYERLDERVTIGAKRNLACKRVTGELIAHWDDDDHYPVWRLSTQVRALQEAGADICGTSIYYYENPASGEAYRYCYAGDRPWVSGNTLMYKREFWLRQPFEDIRAGEDALFLWTRTPKKIVDLKLPSLCVARLHASNTSAKPAKGTLWEQVAPELVQEVRARAAWPLVSCIMPTRNRREFLPLAYELFRQQDYQRLELIVINDGDSYCGDIFGDDPRVQYVRLRTPCTIGEKRNLACRMAKGEIIIHWDDDDWYAPSRVWHQVEPILRKQADITGLENTYTLDAAASTCWRISPELHKKMFVGNVHGGTLAFRKSLLGAEVAYPHTNLAEDAALLQAAVRKGARLLRLENPGLYVYIRHSHNAWRFQAGRFLDPHGWSTTAVPELLNQEWIERYIQAAEAVNVRR